MYPTQCSEGKEKNTTEKSKQSKWPVMQPRVGTMKEYAVDGVGMDQPAT